MFRYLAKPIRYVFTTGVCFLFLISIIGCEKDNKDNVNLDNISYLLFEDLVSIHIKIGGFGRDLNTNEIETLQNSIKNGSDLCETTEPPPVFDRKRDIFFLIMLPGKTVEEIYYKTDTQVMYIGKSIVYRKNTNQYEHSLRDINKYLVGFYTLKPDIGLRRILEQ